MEEDMYFTFDEQKQIFKGFGNSREVYYTSPRVNLNAISGGVNPYSGQNQIDRMLRILNASNPCGCEVQFTGSVLNDLIRSVLTEHGRAIPAFEKEKYRETV